MDSVTLGAPPPRALVPTMLVHRSWLAFSPVGNAVDRTQVDHAGIGYQVTGLGLDVLPGPGTAAPARRCRRARVLGVAARHAEIVGLLPAPIIGSEDRDDPRDLLPAVRG